MVSLKLFKPLGRPMRMDKKLSQLGESTWQQLREAIKEGDADSALALLDYARIEGKGMTDIIVDAWYAFIDWVAHNCGEEKVPEAYRYVKGVLDKSLFEKCADLSVEDLVLWYTEAMRGHFSGLREEGDFKVYEEEDRYVMELDPCGTGGRLMRGGLDGSPSRIGPPFNLGKTTKPYSWSWSKAGTPYYCVHCCLWHEIMAIEIRGYPERITECPVDDPSEPCRIYFYKDPNLIPEFYFERVGLKKDPAKFKR